MKAVQGNIHKVVRVVLNTTNKNRNQWAEIVVNGNRCHRGQPSYIKRIAKAKYNYNVNI